MASQRQENVQPARVWYRLQGTRPLVRGTTVQPSRALDRHTIYICSHLLESICKTWLLNKWQISVRSLMQLILARKWPGCPRWCREVENCQSLARLMLRTTIVRHWTDCHVLSSPISAAHDIYYPNMRPSWLCHCDHYGLNKDLVRTDAAKRDATPGEAAGN